MLGRPVRKGRSIRQLASSCVAALQRQTSVDLSGSETRNQFVASACLSALDLLVHEVCYTGGGRRCPEVFLFMYFLFLERKHTHTTMKGNFTGWVCQIAETRRNSANLDQVD